MCCRARGRRRPFDRQRDPGAISRAQTEHFDASSCASGRTRGRHRPPCRGGYALLTTRSSSAARNGNCGRCGPPQEGGRVGAGDSAGGPFRPTGLGRCLRTGVDVVSTFFVFPPRDHECSARTTHATRRMHGERRRVSHRRREMRGTSFYAQRSPAIKELYPAARGRPSGGRWRRLSQWHAFDSGKSHMLTSDARGCGPPSPNAVESVGVGRDQKPFRLRRSRRGCSYEPWRLARNAAGSSSSVSLE